MIEDKEVEMNEYNKKEIKILAENISGQADFIEHLVEKLICTENNSIERIQCVESIREILKIIKQNKDKVLKLLSEDERIYENDFSDKYVNSIQMRNTRVLVVDDNEINNYVVKQMMKSFCIEADVALSGEEAIKMYGAYEYDMILMDYLMPPGIDGIETVKRIRQDGERGKRQLIIGITSTSDDEFKNGLNEYGVELILYKPLKLQQMAVFLQNELAHKIIDGDKNFTD